MKNDDELRRVLSELPTLTLENHLLSIAKSLPFYFVLAGVEGSARLALRGPRLYGRAIEPVYPGDADWRPVLPEVIGIYQTISEFHTLDSLRERVPEAMLKEYGFPKEDRDLLVDLGMSRSRVDKLSAAIRGSDVAASEELLNSRLNENLMSAETQLIEMVEEEPGYRLFSRFRRTTPAPLAALADEPGNDLFSRLRGRISDPLASVLAFRLRPPRRETVSKAASIVKIGAGGGSIAFDVTLGILGGPLTVALSAFGGIGAVADGVRKLAEEER